jgi:hypothetical protein
LNDPAGAAPSADDAGKVVYWIDERDEIVFVNAAWDRLAAANDCLELAGKRILSRSLWDFISDATTRQIYREIIARVRKGRRISFRLRCDAPDERLFMRIDASRAAAGAVRFEVVTLAAQPRAPESLLRGRAPEPSERSVLMCGWCKRVKVGSDWRELEEALPDLDVFECDSVPLLTHGICADCEQQMTALIEEMGSSPPP